MGVVLPGCLPSSFIRPPFPHHPLGASIAQLRHRSGLAAWYDLLLRSARKIRQCSRVFTCDGSTARTSSRVEEEEVDEDKREVWKQDLRGDLSETNRGGESSNVEAAT